MSSDWVLGDVTVSAAKTEAFLADAHRQCYSHLVQAAQHAAADERAATRCARCLKLMRDFVKRHKVRCGPYAPLVGFHARTSLLGSRGFV